MEELAMKVSLKDANAAKQYLIESENLDHSRKLEKTDSEIYFPVSKRIKKKLDFDYEIRACSLKRQSVKKNFKDLLANMLTKEEYESAKTSFDVVGNIAILEIDKDLRNKEKVIANALLQTNPMIKTVLRKEGSHSGIFRTQGMKYLAGERKKETLHKENDVLLKMDVSKVYFSARQATERKRIASLIKKDERVLVLFSGCAPFPLVISKNSEPKYVCGVEVNPTGHKYAKENVLINKMDNIFLSNRDAHNVEKILSDFKDIPDFDPHFDRIIMPLPKSADEFLDEAFFFSKRNTIVHFYDFLEEHEFEVAHKKIKEVAIKHVLNTKIIETVKCGQHAPHVFRICVDFKVL